MPGSRTVSSRVRNADPGSEGETRHAPASRSPRPGPAPPAGPRAAPRRRCRRRRWPKLKDEVMRAERRGVPVAGDGPGAPAPVKSWREMRGWSAALLLSRTGADVAAWNQRVAAAGLDDEPALREWLAGQGITGYAQALLVWERFGYPDFLTADASELIDGQYADRPQLRPILDAVLALLPALGRRRCRPARPSSRWSAPVARSPWCRRPLRPGWTLACGWRTLRRAAACKRPGTWVAAAPRCGSR